MILAFQVFMVTRIKKTSLTQLLDYFIL